MSKYDSIINLPHYELKNHKRMPLKNRAAQFSPYAALTGYEDNIQEASRLTSKERYLSEDEKEHINMKLQMIEEHLKDNLEVTIFYFEKDNTKEGGEYLEYTGIIRRIDQVNRIIQFNDKTKINIDKILDININYK